MEKFETIEDLKSKVEWDDITEGKVEWDDITEGKFQALTGALKLIEDAYRKCHNCYEDGIRNKKLDYMENFSGRLDELILLYSNIKGVFYTEGKRQLKIMIEEEAE